ncbi:MAG: hypothetical protein EAZ99_19075 [Alphaproteobacteria bacterium]|nr:PfkB family carbohydrate kinase [Alphaproteobacteria bacterium]TAD87017.1 MAG: hypothetical protein EAZ99_19075 [Alphaproteobacteria bacterium]
MTTSPPKLVAVGGAAIDRCYRAIAPLTLGTSNPVMGSGGFGGVARNVAETVARLGCRAALMSIVGDDGSGWALINHLAALGVDVEAVTIATTRATAEYIAVLDADGRLSLGLANMAVFDDLTVADLTRAEAVLADADWVFADANLPADVLAALVARRRFGGGRLAIDAVSVPKVGRLPDDLSGIDVLMLNRAEAAALLSVDAAEPLAALTTALLARGAGALVLSDGDHGALVADPAGVVRVPALRASRVDETGAGDALIGATLAALAAGLSLVDAVRRGTAAAALTVEFPGAVRPDLTAALIDQALAGRQPRGNITDAV